MSPGGRGFFGASATSDGVGVGVALGTVETTGVGEGEGAGGSRFGLEHATRTTPALSSARCPQEASRNGMPFSDERPRVK
jgi:hypothetical protein